MDGSAVASAVRVARNSDSWLSRLRGLSPVITRLADGAVVARQQGGGHVGHVGHVAALDDRPHHGMGAGVGAAAGGGVPADGRKLTTHSPWWRWLTTVPSCRPPSNLKPLRPTGVWITMNSSAASITASLPSGPPSAWMAMVRISGLLSVRGPRRSAGPGSRGVSGPGPCGPALRAGSGRALAELVVPRAADRCSRDSPAKGCG